MSEGTGSWFAVSNHLGELGSLNTEKSRMGPGGKDRPSLLAGARTAARLLSKTASSPVARAEACLQLLSEPPAHDCLSTFYGSLGALPIEERHYWVGTVYTLMLPAKVRRSQATYFTPPAVADTVVELAVEAGFDMQMEDALDPAAGGAAFLSTLAGKMKASGLESEDVACKLNGIEIDKGLARLAHRLIEERLGTELTREVVIAGDALCTTVPATYGLVIANPPYGRVNAEDVQDEKWRRVAHSGHVNKYALFTELSFRAAKPGGLIVLVIPSSFRAGPLYDRMREFIRAESEVLTIASIESRDGVFVDVAQDISVLVARKGERHRKGSKVSFSVIGTGTPGNPAVEARLPDSSGAAWPLPVADLSTIGGARLRDYGVHAKAGYFVWNRERHRMRKKRDRTLVYPLIWARNVRPGKLCRPAGKNGGAGDLIAFEGASTAVVTKPAAVMQRTTNDKQRRRLIVAMVDPAVVDEWGGFVTENHTIVLTADVEESLALAVELLNTAAVDARYRRVSGTATVSVSLLRQLDLPRPEAFSAALEASCGDAEAAAEEAYLIPSKSVCP